ncbi:MAG: hypothetical protein ACREOW_18455 [Thermodesulfobacteriota bacterium]
MYKILISTLLLTLLAFSFVQTSVIAATNLRLNPNLDYSSDSNDGPLITGDNNADGMIQQGKPAHVIFYHHECYNSKRQAKRTVELYEKYEGKVDFIIVDLDSEISNEQKELRDRFYRNYIPHVTIIGAKGSVLYNRSGEIGADLLSSILDKALM